MLQILFGQCLALILFLGYKSSEKLNKRKYWFPLQDIGRIILIFILNFLLIKNENNKDIDVNWRDYFICTATDFFGGFFLQKAYAKTAGSLVVFICQLMYPMMLITVKIIYDISPDLKIHKIILFILIVCICAIVNTFSFQNILGNPYLGIFYAFLSNSFFITNCLICKKIIDCTNSYIYLRNMTIVSMITCPLFGIFTQFKQIPNLNDITAFYNHNFLYFSLSSLSFALFYILGTIFIEKNGPTIFNLNTLSTSIYFGFFNLMLRIINKRKFKRRNKDLFLVLGYLTALFIYLFLLYGEMGAY